jgi:hypothetical protein
MQKLGYRADRFNLAQRGGETQPVDGLYASGSYFPTLGVQALLGRTFAAEWSWVQASACGRRSSS